MEALFVIPTLISPSVNDRLVPAICKMVERNIVLTNSAVLRAAIFRKYSGKITQFTKTARHESIEPIEEQGGKKWEDQADPYETTTGGLVSADIVRDMLDRGNLERPGDIGKTTVATPEQIELPHGITFFHTISLEPTYIVFPMSLKSGFMFGGMSRKDIVVGFKAVPYKVDGVDDIVSMMEFTQSKSLILRFLNRHKNQLLNKLMIFSKRWWSYKGQKQGGFTDIIYAPSNQQLSRPGYLASLMDARKSKAWSTMVILSTFDFKNDDLKQTLLNYRKLVQAGWSDMVIMNDSKESVHFCTSKMAACFELPYTYMKQVMNLSNVLDYSEISRWNRPMNVSSVGKAFSESGDMVPDAEDTKALIYEILNS